MFLDTTFCIDLMRERRRGEHGPATRRLEELRDIPLYMSVFAACELQAGARMSDRPTQELRKVEMLTEFVEMVLPDRSFAVAYGEAEAFLRKRGKRVPVMDLLIGVMAQAQGMPLLTADDSNFREIPGLVVETYR